MLINEEINNEQIHNNLVSLVKQYNQIPNSYTNKKYDLYRQILNKTRQLNYNLTNIKGELVILNGDKPIRTIANRTSVDEIQQHKILTEYPEDFQQFVNKLISFGGLSLHNIDTVANLDVAQKDILNGKKSVSANNTLDSLENMFEIGAVRIKASKHTPDITIPIEEYFDELENNDSNDEDFWQHVFSNIKENKMNLTKSQVNNLATLILERIDYKKGLENMVIRKRDPEFFSEKYMEWNNNGYKTPTESSVLEFLQNNYEDLSTDDEFKQALLKKLNDNMKNENKTTNNLEKLIEGIVRPLLEGKSGDYMKAIKKADRELEYELTGPGWKAKDKAHKDKTKYDRKRDKKTNIDEDIEIMDEATYSFDSEDPNLQQKTDKLKNDTTLFNKDNDEIKINTESKKIVLTKNQIMEMNQLRQLNKKNVFTKNQIIEMLKKKMI